MIFRLSASRRTRVPPGLHSSIAINVRPDSLAELLRVVGVPKEGKHRERAFNAAADAWGIYVDAQDQGALPV